MMVLAVAAVEFAGGAEHNTAVAPALSAACGPFPHVQDAEFRAASLASAVEEL